LKEHIFKVERFPLGRLYRFGMFLWLMDFINYFLGRQADILLMGIFSVPTFEIGYYNIAFTLTMTLSTLLLGGFEGVSLSALAEIDAKHGKGSLGQAWSVIIKATNLLSLPVLIFAICFAREIVSALYSDAYLPTVVLFQVFALFALVIRLLGGGVHTTVLCATDREKLAFYLRLAGGILNLVLDLLLIPRYKAIGAIVATGSSGVVLMILEMWITMRYLRAKYPVSFLSKVLLVSLLALSIVRLIPAQSIPSLIGTGLAYGAVIVGLLYLVKPLSEEDRALLAKANNRLYIALSRF